MPVPPAVPLSTPCYESATSHINPVAIGNVLDLSVSEINDGHSSPNSLPNASMSNRNRLSKNAAEVGAFFLEISTFQKQWELLSIYLHDILNSVEEFSTSTSTAALLQQLTAFGIVSTTVQCRHHDGTVLGTRYTVYIRPDDFHTVSGSGNLESGSSELHQHLFGLWHAGLVDAERTAALLSRLSGGEVSPDQLFAGQSDCALRVHIYEAVSPCTVAEPNAIGDNCGVLTVILTAMMVMSVVQLQLQLCLCLRMLIYSIRSSLLASTQMTPPLS